MWVIYVYLGHYVILFKFYYHQHKHRQLAGYGCSSIWHQSKPWWQTLEPCQDSQNHLGGQVFQTRKKNKWISLWMDVQINHQVNHRSSNFKAGESHTKFQVQKRKFLWFCPASLVNCNSTTLPWSFQLRPPKLFEVDPPWLKPVFQLNEELNWTWPTVDLLKIVLICGFFALLPSFVYAR